jgi:hypothetical protein
MLFPCSLEDDFRRLIPRPVYLHIPISGRSVLSCLTCVRLFSQYLALRPLGGICTTLPVLTLVSYYICSELSNLSASLADATDER